MTLGRMPYSYQLVAAHGATIQVSVYDADGVLHQRQDDDTGALSDSYSITLRSFDTAVLGIVDGIVRGKVVETQLREAGGPAALLGAMISQGARRQI